MSVAGVEYFVPSLGYKGKYVFHYRNLQLFAVRNEADKNSLRDGI